MTNLHRNPLPRTNVALQRMNAAPWTFLSHVRFPSSSDRERKRRLMELRYQTNR
jgi:hypothetical protein